MNRVELEAYIAEAYGAEDDRPWKEYPNYVVFRHSNNHNFYINKPCFHVIRIETPREWTSGEGQFILEKRMKQACRYAYIMVHYRSERDNRNLATAWDVGM